MLPDISLQRSLGETHILPSFLARNACESWRHRWATIPLQGLDLFSVLPRNAPSTVPHFLRDGLSKRFDAVDS